MRKKTVEILEKEMQALETYDDTIKLVTGDDNPFYKIWLNEVEKHKQK